MSSYYLKSRQTAESKIPKIVGTKNGRTKLLGKYEVCDSKK